MVNNEKFKKIMASKTTGNNLAVGLMITPRENDHELVGVYYYNLKYRLPITIMYN